MVYRSESHTPSENGSERDDSRLRLSELLCENAPDAVLVVDKSGSIVQALGATYDVLGYTREGLVGIDVERLIPLSNDKLPLDTRSGSQPHPAAERVRRLASEARRADGKTIPVSVILSHFEWEKEQLTLAVVRDMSPDWSNEPARRETPTNDYRSLFESSVEAMFVSTPDGGILEANAAMCRLLGSSEHRPLAGMSLDSVAESGDLKRFQQLIQRTGAVRDFQIRLRSARGVSG